MVDGIIMIRVNTSASAPMLVYIYLIAIKGVLVHLLGVNSALLLNVGSVGVWIGYNRSSGAFGTVACRVLLLLSTPPPPSRMCIVVVSFAR